VAIASVAAISGISIMFYLSRRKLLTGPRSLSRQSR
jgi:hypothetical protein